MINNIYELEDGKQYVVILEENYNNRKFVGVLECNYEKDEINDEDIIVKEVISNNGDIMFKSLDDKEANKILIYMIGKNIPKEK